MQFELLGAHTKQFVKLSQGKNFLFVRHGECMANYSGVLAGFLDSRLTVKGREQANTLFKELYKYEKDFKNVYSSDLSRAVDTAEIALGFPNRGRIIQSRDLRELNFGNQENQHYDSLPNDQKDLINHISFQAEGGESWGDVKNRVKEYMKQQPDGNHLVFSHGGLMCTLTWELGIQDCLPNCSAIGLSVDQDGEPNDLIFSWVYPQVEEL